MRGWRAFAAAWVLGLLTLTGCGDVPVEDADPAEPLTPFDAIPFDTLYQVGAATGQSWESFHGLWDIAVDAQGRLAILDLGGPAVHVYDAQGAHLVTIDQIGGEAGQLDGPTGIDWAAPGELLVWDPGSSWISSFQVSGSSAEFVDRRAAAAFGETGFCASGDRAFLSYLEGGNVVHEIGPDGIANSFGPAPAVAGAETLGAELAGIALEEMTPSALLCTGTGVVDVGLSESNIRYHSQDGAMTWSQEFVDFRPIAVYSDDGIGLGRRFDAGEGSHLFRSVVPLGDSLLLVQHELRTREIPMEGEPEVFESRLISVMDGSEVARTRDFPLVLAGQGDRLYLVQQSPYPMVTVVGRGGA